MGPSQDSKVGEIINSHASVRFNQKLNSLNVFWSNYVQNSHVDTPIPVRSLKLSNIGSG